MLIFAANFLIDLTLDTLQTVGTDNRGSTNISPVFHQHPYYLLLPYAIKTIGPVEGSLEGFIERSPEIKSSSISVDFRFSN
ncbi:hypothetical protein L2E82_05862 [Cichorium intybus]|uniref:Uncharacterized protein n=1 Tax=Cichorium intybus TaxID=13427 RepID=A0ACB9H7Y9_CICIN|nr:hypothetical protein L2E82_05862 [Cichorium intybus]